MDVKALQARLRDFAAARDWQPYHSPKNLAMALMVEAAELMELFQWQTITESRGFTRNASDKERVGDEIADVLLYLLQLADHTGVDVEEAVERKLRKNAEKHPAKHTEKAAPGPKGHLLIDWENVQPRGEELRKLVPEGTDVWLFHGPKQKVDVSSHLLAYGASKVTLIPRPDVIKKNALDFQLSYYIGYISARQPQERFVVVSNDTGYDPMLEHARELGFDAKRCEFRRPTAPSVVPPAKPKTASTAFKAKAPPLSPASAVLSAAPASEPSAAQIAWRVIVHLRKLPEERRPAQPDEWQVLVEALVHEQVRDKAALARRACQLVQGRPLGLARAPDGLQLAGGTPKVLFTPAVKKTAVRPTAAQPPTVAKKFVAAPKTALAKQGAKEPPAPIRARKATQQAGKMVAPAAKKTAPPPTATEVAQAVLTSLKKMPKNKPTRRAGLLKFIETHAAKAADPKAMAQQVCVLLETRKDVVPSQDGKGVVYPKLSINKASSA